MTVAGIEKVELPEKLRRFVQENMTCYPHPKGVLVPALMECQKHYGQVTPGVVRALGELTGIPFAEVQAVVSFYTMIFTKPTGKYLIGVCRTWNCEDEGALELVEHFCGKYGCEEYDVAADGLFTIFTVECLCDCHNAPSVQFLCSGEKFKDWWCNNLTVGIFDKILDGLAAGEEDALRERLVRIDQKQNPPDERRWIWLVTTRNQYPAWVEEGDGGIVIHDGFGKLGQVKEENPKLYKEITETLVEA